MLEGLPATDKQKEAIKRLLLKLGIDGEPGEMDSESARCFINGLLYKVKYGLVLEE